MPWPRGNQQNLPSITWCNTRHHMLQNLEQEPVWGQAHNSVPLNQPGSQGLGLDFFKEELNYFGIKAKRPQGNLGSEKGPDQISHGLWGLIFAASETQPTHGWPWGQPFPDKAKENPYKAFYLLRDIMMTFCCRPYILSLDMGKNDCANIS